MAKQLIPLIMQRLPEMLEVNLYGSFLDASWRGFVNLIHKKTEIMFIGWSQDGGFIVNGPYYLCNKYITKKANSSTQK